MEDHARDFLVFEQSALAQQLQQMPGNRFALAIGVSGKQQGVGFLQAAGNLVDVLRVAIDHVVAHREIVLGIDRAFLGHQIAHMAVRGQNLVVLAEIFLDRPGLGRRFHDDEIATHRYTLFEEWACTRAQGAAH